MSSSAVVPTPAVASSLSVLRGTIDAAALQHVAQELKVSTTTVLFAAINILHYRYTGLTECDVKLRLAPITTQDEEDPSSHSALPMNAAFVNTVLKNTMTFGQVLQTAQDSLQKEIASSGSKIDLSAHNFQLEFFQLISAELSGSGFQHLVNIYIHCTGASSKKRKIVTRYEFPPMLTPGQADPRLRVNLHLPGIIEGMARMAKKKDLAQTPIHELQFLPPEERSNLMKKWSGLSQYDLVDRTDQLLQELFEETARKFPERIAIECASPVFRCMTYAQMSRRTNQLARWMRNNGVQVGSYVGMWMPRGMEMYIALIAILKAGGAYVPCDSEYPSDRVNFILDDCKAPILVTHSELLESHPDFVLPPGCQMIQYDKVDDLMEEQDDTFPTREQTGQTNKDVCYVIYTSGSTGRPKGCCLEHRCAVNLVRAERILFGVHERDRVYQGFSIAFDASVEEVWLAFASGATLVSATPDMLHAGPSLPEMIVAQRITVISTVPTLLSMMEDHMPDVRILISGGEAVQKDLIKRWAKHHPESEIYRPDLPEPKGASEAMLQMVRRVAEERKEWREKDMARGIHKRRFINTYGPTEATVIATHVDTDPSAPLVTIGSAVPSYFLYILDANLNPVPVGVGGELHIGGMCVARGYLAREDLTKEKFIPFPSEKLWGENEEDVEETEAMFARSPRIYKAGDLCRWTEEGEVEFCGRIDAQVKLRGYRVELSEIESVLMTQENIQSAVVSVREDVPGIQNLIGYVILKNASLAFDQDVIKEGIRVRLPPYMIPACIDVLTKFPTLPSGKVNRKELPPPKNLVVINYDEDPDEADATAGGGGDASASSSSAGGASSEIVPKNLDEDPNYFPPRTVLEKKLAQMWRKLFQRPRISSTDDFFTLGGHSLLAAWLVSALRKDPTTEHVTMADVYGFPKLRDLSCKLTGGDPTELMEVEEEAELYRQGKGPLQLAAAAASAGGGNASGSSQQESKESQENQDDQNDGDIPLPSMGGDSGANGNAGGDDSAGNNHLASFAPISNLRFILCGIFQFISLYFLFALPAMQIGIPWEFYLKIRADGWQYIMIMLLPYSVAIFPIYVFVAITTKWLLIGKYKEGKHELWGWYYFRWWLVQRLIYYIPLIYLRGSPVLNTYFRLMGARIGKNVFLNTHLIEAPDLVEIGDDTSIGIDAQIINFHVEQNWLYIRKVVIGKCCYVGARSVVAGGSVICDHGQLGAMSLLTQGTHLPPWEHWRGSPAIKTARVENFVPRHLAHPGAMVATQGLSPQQQGGLSQRKNKSVKSTSNGKSNGHAQNGRRALNPGSLSSSGMVSSLTPAQQDSLYDHDGSSSDDEHQHQEHDVENPPGPTFPGSLENAAQQHQQNGHSTTNGLKSPQGLFGSQGDLSEHLLSENGASEAFSGQSVYVGVGEESIAWSQARPSACARFMLGFGQTMVLTVLLPVMVLIALFPGMYLLHRLMPTDVTVSSVHYEESATWQYLAASAPMSLSFFLLLCWQITIVKWTLIGQIQPGDYKVHSWFYLRKWTVDTLMQLSIQVLHPIYSTMFLIPWFRSLGAVIGDRCEIATAVYAAPDLIHVGDECFLADTVYLGVPAVHMGTIRLGKISLGNRVFVGNGACLPMQTMIGHGCLVGVMSAPPLAHPLGDSAAVMHWPEPALRSENGTAWLGNPAMFLPRRQAPKGDFDDSVTYHPAFFMQLGRMVMEFIKMTLPFLLFIVSMLVLMGDFQLIRGRFSAAWQFWVIWPLLYMGAGVGCCFVVIMLKWLLIGKYIAGESPLWSTFIWRHDLITSLLDSLAHPYFINQLRGTPFVSLWFRLLGAQIGSRVWMDTTAITEPDLVHIGDDAALHNDAQIQTHLFEDRILKMSHLEIGNKCSIGNSAIVLYDSMMHEGSHLLPLSLLMKGESLQAWTSYEGVPCHRTHNIGAEAPVITERITRDELAGN